MRRRLLVCLVLVVIVVALLPAIIAKTALRNVVLSAAMPSDQLRATIGEASLGWLSPPVLSAVEVKDAAGVTLLTVESIRMDRPLWSLLLNAGELGSIEFVRPALYAEMRADGSNVEDLLHELLPRSSGESTKEVADQMRPSPWRVALRVVDGAILANDTANGRRWRLQEVNLQFDSHHVTGVINQFAFAGQLVDVTAPDAGRQAGQFAISLAPGESGRQQFSWRIDAFAMAVVRPWLSRYIAGSQIDGTLAGQGTATWTAGASQPFPADFASSGMLSIDRLNATAPVLAGDRLRLERVELPWQFTSQPVGLVFDDLRLRSDVGQVAVRGVVDPKSLASSLGIDAAALDAASRHDLELRGALDLAKLAAMLPRALRIRNNTTITSGVLEISARHEPAPGGQIVSGQLRTANLAGTSAGRPLRWDEPINATFALQRENGAVRLNALRCESEFLQVEASGTQQQFAAAATFDLNRLVSQLGQFVDLRGIELAGTGEAGLKWNQADAAHFAAEATGELAELRIALPRGKVWTEPQLAVSVDVAGTMDSTTRRPARIESGKIALDAQGDELDAQLTQPVDITLTTPSWPLAITVKGNLDRWLTRARPWFNADPWQIAGEGELVANIRVANRAAEAKDTRLAVTNLQATAPGWNIIEPRVELVGDGRWDEATGEAAATSVQFVTSTVSLVVKDMRYRAPQLIDGQQSIGHLNGVAAFRADLARLTAWRTLPSEPPQYQMAGAITGNVRFEQHADGIRGEVTAMGQNLSLADRGRGRPGSLADYQTIWEEPSVRLRGLASYDAASDRVAFNECAVQSNTLQANVGGQIENASTTGDMNVSGTIDYDLAQITPLLKPYLGEGIQLKGREQGRFAVVGQLGQPNEEHALISSNDLDDPYRVVSTAEPVPEPSPGPSLTGREDGVHWSRRLRGQLEAPWSGASLYGMPVGGGKIAAVLSDGAIRVEPISVAVGEGRLTAAPAVRLDPLPAEVTLPAGPLITNVRISPEVSEAMLKYVAPVLAGATQSEGLFSMQLDGVRVPLGETQHTDATGRLTVHSVRVVPGPLANQWIGLAHQIEAIAKRRDAAALAQRPPLTLLAIRDQAVNFRVMDGRVHHEQMEFSVDDVVLRSQGSVGFDEMLSLVLQVPIQDRWVERERLLVSLKGQTLSIPIAGTLTRPQMDQRAIGSLSQHLLQGAAQQAIGGELNKALEKLFKAK